MTYLKVRDHEHLVRDSYSKAILNTDRKALEEYYSKVEFLKQQKAEQEETKMRISMLEKNMEEIKNLLSDIANRRK
jgi:hypothetical protein